MSSRSLTPLEEAEARTVFADGILYHRVHIAENARWTNALPRVYDWLAGHPQPIGDNAIALGHHLLFPRRLRTSVESLAAGDVGDLAWLIHELTHVWQAERIGWRYLGQALWVHLRHQESAYDFGGEPAMLAAIDGRRPLRSFNVEQQAEIARACYLRRRVCADMQARVSPVAPTHSVQEKP
jgi:hypothetical protein